MQGWDGYDDFLVGGMEEVGAGKVLLQGYTWPLRCLHPLSLFCAPQAGMPLPHAHCAPLGPECPPPAPCPGSRLAHLPRLSCPCPRPTFGLELSLLLSLLLVSLGYAVPQAWGCVQTWGAGTQRERTLTPAHSLPGEKDTKEK